MSIQQYGAIGDLVMQL